jgi:rod shape determining protein RodA
VALGQLAVNLLNFKKQIFSIVSGLILLFIFAIIDYHNLRNYSNYFYILGVITLIGVFLFGQTIRGTKSWFYLAGFGFQPVEFIKLILILFLARYLSSTSFKINQPKHLFITALGVIIFIVLILVQPDFGSALILFLAWLVLITLAGFNKKYIISIILTLLIILLGSWFLLFKDYQKQRIITFLNPRANQFNQGYNAAQALIAVGAGGMMGRGIGFGSQTQLKFLPEAQTDFIFAVSAEELGFLGVIFILLFFSIFFYRCLYYLRRLNDNFGIFFILGAASLIFIEMFINIGMNIGLLPVIGISLPFLSYGGSAMVFNLIMVGVIESIIIRSKMSY